MPEIKREEQCILHTEKIHELELSMVEIEGNVKHIRERIDNGLGTTITKVWDKLQEMAIDRAKIAADVKENTSFIGKLKTAMIWIIGSGVLGGFITIVWKTAYALMMVAPIIPK